MNSIKNFSFFFSLVILLAGCSNSSRIAELEKKLEIHEANLKILNQRVTELDRFSETAKQVLGEHREHLGAIERTYPLPKQRAKPNVKKP